MESEESEYSLNLREYYYGGGGSKKKRLLTLGLPLGSALVLIALLNTIFTLKSILSFTELVTLTGTFAAKSHLIYLVIVVILLLLTIYLWAAVIFTGRGYHLSIWIAGTVLLLLLKVVISTWTLILLLSSKDTLYWRKFWALGVDIGMEVYVIAVAVVAANVMWRRDDQQQELRIQQQCGGAGEGHNSGCGYNLSIPPIGLKPKQFIEFYKRNVELGAKIFILLDVIYSAYALTTEKVPEIVVAKEYFTFARPPGVNLVDTLVVKISDVLMHFLRIIIGLMAIVVIMKERKTSRRLVHILFLQLMLATLSMIIYFYLFGHFEELSVTDRFYQTEFTGEIILRLIIIAFVLKSVENRRLQHNHFINSETIQIIEFCQ